MMLTTPLDLASQLAAYSRAEIAADDRRDFFVYIDEFQSFTTLAVANMFAELRKYRVGFTVAHQYLHQLETEPLEFGSYAAAGVNFNASPFMQ